MVHNCRVNHEYISYYLQQKSSSYCWIFTHYRTSFEESTIYQFWENVWHKSLFFQLILLVFV